MTSAFFFQNMENAVFSRGILCLQKAMQTEFTHWPFWESVCEEKHQDGGLFAVHREQGLLSLETPSFLYCPQQ